MATTTKTVRDIATENPAAVRVFEKYGLDYCCGGRVPLAEACATKWLNVDEVIASLKTATAPSAPRRERLGQGVARQPGRIHCG
jgi:regulator of cell morphogenesis and NO signaling